MTVDGLFNHAGHFPDRRLDSSVVATETPPHHGPDQSGQGHHDEQVKRQTGALIDHDADHDEHHQAVEDGHLERIGHGLRHLLGTVGDARNDLPGGLAIEPACGQLLVALKHRIAQIAHHTAPYSRHAVIGGETGNAAQQEQAHQEHRKPADRKRIACVEQVVQHRLQGPGEGPRSQRIEQHAEHGQRGEQGIGPRIAEQASVGRPGRSRCRPAISHAPSLSTRTNPLTRWQSTTC